MIEEREKAIKKSYDLLLMLSKERQEILQNSLKLFDFYSECEDFNKWMKDKSKSISAEEDVTKATKTFQKFLKDFSLNKKRLEQIDQASKQLEVIFPELKQEITGRGKDTHRIYDNMVRMQEQMEKKLEGSASVIYFQKSCEDVSDWITEKSEKLEMEDLAKDLTTVKALQRKHKGIERELAPIKDKVLQVSQLGKNVIDGFPAEKMKIEQMILDIQEKWEMLENKAMDRSKRLEDAVGMQLFNSGVKSLLQWVDATKNTLNTNENVRDVQTAEELLNKHAEIGDDIRAKQDEFTSLIQLGEKMYGRQPSQDMEEKVQNLKEERKVVLRGWQQKGDFLRQVRDLQLFNREADRIDATISAQMKLLDSLSNGDNLPDVEASLKRHEDFTATILVQEERFNAFKDLANQLINAGHLNKESIEQRRDKVLEGRENLKQKSEKKRGDLDESKLFQDFRTEVDEMLSFVQEKKKLLKDDSFKDGIGNIKAKAKKHQVLEGEIKSNTAQLKVINRTGQQMINRNHFKSAEIGQELEKLNAGWETLQEAVKEQGSRLGQAEAQIDYNRMTADIKTKLGDVRSLMTAEETGHDIRGCKKLQTQYAAGSAELVALETKVETLAQVAQDLADGHFDGASILKNCQDLRQEVNQLKHPAQERKAALDISLQFHEFYFDLQRELEWIAEKITIISG